MLNTIATTFFSEIRKIQIKNFLVICYPNALFKEYEIAFYLTLNIIVIFKNFFSTSNFFHLQRKLKNGTIITS